MTPQVQDTVPGLAVEEGKDALRISWDNRKIRKDRFQFWFFLLFWMIWAPVTFFITALAFVAETPAWVFFAIWSLFGWLGTLGIPFTFVQRTWNESITIDATGLLFEKRGWLAGKPQRIPADLIESIALGRYNDGSDHESKVSLNLFHRVPGKSSPKRLILGFWLGPQITERVFAEVRRFLVDREIPIPTRIMENR